ncbi:PAS domain-containing sensor histidine kinase [Methanolobus mangrovi]|uniref:histidine kinase n=1 Tax=Methanolobus mangrovi TaxID=3072977 RepID=A0AA51UF80_9EURY|nr:PAS domain-containing sensor histidine kinase [Methanolobus mangrovi]WMW22095.1 PAS domain-containing sensor histidine kinase [Methanolobus mangrovi]
MATKKETLDFSDNESDNSHTKEDSVRILGTEIPFSEIERSQFFFDLLDSFILVIDENDRIILANKKARRFFGFDEKDISNEIFSDLCIQECEKEDVLSFFSSVLSDDGAEPRILETSIMGYDRIPKTFLLNTSLLKDTISSDKALLLSCTDIQEKKDLEMELLFDTEMIFSHLDSIPYALVLSDYTGMITFWNKNASKLFGYGRDEMLGKPIGMIMPKRYRKAHEGWNEVISIGKSPVVGKIIEVTGLRKDGTEFPLELAITTTRLKGEVFHGAIINDISKRKMKERLTLIAKNKYRMMFEKSPLGIFHFDEKGVITQCNENLVKIMGVPEESVISNVIGFNIVESFDDDNSIKKAIMQVLAGIPASYEDDFCSPFSDKVIPIKAEFSPVISDEGKFMGGVCVVEDFTERKAAEKALNQYAQDLAKANEELKSLDRMKDEFLSNLRHELKTPLIPIKGYSELMYEEALGELNQKQKDAMEKVMLSSERLKRLIDSLLYVSITEGGNVEYTFLPLRISEVIDAAIHDRSPEITSKGHEIEKLIPSDIPLIEGDLDYLEEVFVNIIDNSVKFTPESGKISISVTLQDNSKIHIQISDNGIGISEKNLPHIFNRFYQADGSSTRKYGGNGLGLYICKKIIVAHKGDMWADSKEGKGTSIHILLPVK